jgi:hypothetical protein
MLLIPVFAFMLLISPQASSRPHIPPSQLNDIATILAHDEGWPLGDPDYTLDPMKPDVDDGFDSIGVYHKAHLVRMYSIDRTTGDVVDFMRGCQVFRFEDIKRFQAEMRQKSNARALTDQQLAAKAGCPKLTVVNTRWVH